MMWNENNTGTKNKLFRQNRKIAENSQKMMKIDIPSLWEHTFKIFLI